jgi:hypothetical protein
MNRNFSFINLIASKLPSPPKEAPEVKSVHPDDETELSVMDF